MEPITLTILFKGIGMLLSIFAGLMTIRYGFHLYKDGAGSGKDHLAFELGNIKFTAHSVGSVVMSTAFLWGFIAMSMSPNYTDGTITVDSSLVSVIEDFHLVSEPVDMPDKIISSPDALKGIFVTTALSGANDFESRRWGYFKEGVAKISYDTTSYLKSENGQYYITANMETDTEVARMAFIPTVNEDNQIVFRFEGVSKAIPKIEESLNK